MLVNWKKVMLGIMIEFENWGLFRVWIRLEFHHIQKTTKYVSLWPKSCIILQWYYHFKQLYLSQSSHLKFLYEVKYKKFIKTHWIPNYWSWNLCIIFYSLLINVSDDLFNIRPWEDSPNLILFGHIFKKNKQSWC